MLLAFRGKEEIHQQYLDRIRSHRINGQILVGDFLRIAHMHAYRLGLCSPHYALWKDGCGSAVGCTIHGSDYFAYERELGIPAWLAYLEDRIFELLPVEMSQQWPELFLSSIQPGADLSNVWSHLVLWFLQDPDHGIARCADSQETHKTIVQIADLFRQRCSNAHKWEMAAWDGQRCYRTIHEQASGSYPREQASGWAAYAAAELAVAAKNATIDTERSAIYSAAGFAHAAICAVEASAYAVSSKGTSEYIAARAAACYRLSQKLLYLLSAAT